MTANGISWPEPLRILVERYGESSNAALMARLEWLIDLLADDTVSPQRWQRLRSRIEEHYTLDHPVPSSVSNLITVAIDETGEVVYKFSGAAYQERYAAGENAQDDTVVIRNRGDLEPLADRSWRLFVVTADNDLIIHTHAMDVTELILNRNDSGGTVPLVHPTLVVDRGLAVKAAGEIALTRTSTGDVATVFNTKSGHFCPAPETVQVASSVLFSAAGVERVAAIPVRLRVPAVSIGAA